MRIEYDYDKGGKPERDFVLICEKCAAEIREEGQKQYDDESI